LKSAHLSPGERIQFKRVIGLVPDMIASQLMISKYFGAGMDEWYGIERT